MGACSSPTQVREDLLALVPSFLERVQPTSSALHDELVKLRTFPGEVGESATNALALLAKLA